jgi:hypothetical protein
MKTGSLPALLAHDLTISQNPKLSIYDWLCAAVTAYVWFAVKAPGFFSVMFQADVIRKDSGALIAANINSRQVLINCLEEFAGAGVDPRVVLGM